MERKFTPITSANCLPDYASGGAVPATSQLTMTGYTLFSTVTMVVLYASLLGVVYLYCKSEKDYNAIVKAMTLMQKQQAH